MEPVEGVLITAGAIVALAVASKVISDLSIAADKVLTRYSARYSDKKTSTRPVLSKQNAPTQHLHQR
jgi:hypothetical protein